MSTPIRRGIWPHSYPCRCLWRGLLQITYTLPPRRTSLQFSQMRLTLDRTFMEQLPSRPRLRGGLASVNAGILYCTLDRQAGKGTLDYGMGFSAAGAGSESAVTTTTPLLVRAKVCSMW